MLMLSLLWLDGVVYYFDRSAFNQSGFVFGLAMLSDTPSKRIILIGGNDFCYVQPCLSDRDAVGQLMVGVISEL